MQYSNPVMVELEMYRGWIAKNPDLFESSVREFVGQHRAAGRLITVHAYTGNIVKLTARNPNY